MDEREYEYYSQPNFWTNTNNIWVSICGPIRIRIFVIRIIFQYYSNTELFAHLWYIFWQGSILYCKFFYVLHCVHSLKSIIQFQTKLIFTFNICIFVRQIYKKINQRFVKICIKLQTIAFTTILK